MNVLQSVPVLAVLAVLAVASTPAAPQEALDFVSQDGLCDAREYEEIARLPASGSSVTIRAQQIKSGSFAASPMTDAVVPAFTPVRCYGRSGNFVLVLSEDSARDFCGWIDRAALLRGAATTGAGIDGGERNIYTRGREVACPTMQPMTVTQYCQRIEQIGDYEPLCDDVRDSTGRFRENPIDTKFLTWNANTSGAADRTVVPLFDEPDPDSRMGDDLSVFNVMRVWDIEKGPDDGLYALVGPDQSSVVGWAPASAGTVWFSKLTTFFSRAGQAPILTAEPGTSGADVFAERPPNLGEMLDGRTDFDKYPVLVDGRDASVREGTRQEPHLRIAFIGALCDEGAICADVAGERIVDRVQALEAVDILFLIDATKSMKAYFSIVADAVTSVALERSSSTTRFGVTMYGDFLDRNNQALGAPIQFRRSIALTEIFSGDEFEGLSDERLYIRDPAYDPGIDRDRGRPEASYAALFQAIGAAAWRDEAVRFVIHIADHGDRRFASDTLVQAMKAQRILYVPIAVQGEYEAEFNAAFVEQSDNLLSRLRVGAAALGLPTQTTFEGGSLQTNAAASRSILKSLRAATELQDVVTAEVIATLEGRDAAATAQSNRYPPGYAQLTAAVRTLYGIETDDIAASIESRTLAAPGFIAIPASGKTKDWEFQVAIAPRDLKTLIQNFDLLCASMGASGAQNDLTAALRSVIQILTGDVFGADQDRFYAYFDNRDEIPLVTRTILGEGILDLGIDLNSFSSQARGRVEVYRREACRTSKLLKLMDSDRLVERPFEIGVDGRQGDLVWDESSQTYNDLRSRPFTWTQNGLYGVLTIYLPLKYLPRPYTEL